MSRVLFGCTLAASLMLLSSPVLAQAIIDDAVTADQTTVGTVFDSKGSVAPGGSSLETDYNNILSGTSAEVAQSAQSLLPTTAYGMANAATALATTEERNVMGRLRTLRQGTALRPSRVVTAPTKAPLVYPLQETSEALHDLRAKTKATTTSGKYGTTNYYRSFSRALYKELPEAKPQEPSIAQKAYNSTMQAITTGAGAPNENRRDSGEPRVRLVPNMADRAAAQTLNFAGDVGGQGQVHATATGGLPRHVAIPLSEANRMAASRYRGQPLSGLSSSASTQPVPLTPAPPLTVIHPYNDPLNPPPPVIYGPNDPVPPPQVTIEPAPGTAPMATAPDSLGEPSSTAAPTVSAAPARKEPFVYKKIDQDAGLTTPQIGSPSSTKARTTILLPQNNAMAVISSQETNVVGRVPLRKTTDTGSYVWSGSERNTGANQAPSPSMEPQTQPQQAAPNYGSRAIPLHEEAAVNPDQRWGFFVTGTTGFGSNELQQTSDKTKTTTAGFTAGGDYRLADQSYLGLALTYVHSNMATGSFGDLKSNSVALSLYGTTSFAKNAYADGYISVGYLNMDSERTIFAAGNPTSKAKGSPDGFQFSGKAETGYDFKQEAWTYGPFAGFRLAYADFGSFTEEDAGNYNLKVKGFNNLSAIASLGAGGTYRYAMSNGGVLLPGLRAGYNHEFGDDRSDIKAEFANLANASFSTKGSKKSRDWVNVTPSVTASLPNDWTLVAQYEHDFFRDDVDENIFNLAAHYKW